MDETKPLLIEGASSSGSSSPVSNGHAAGGKGGEHQDCSKTAFAALRWCGILALVAAAFASGTRFGGHYSYAPDADAYRPSSASQPPPPPAVDAPPSTMRYRPFCIVYGQKMGFAGILQTSMGAPSQQWSHIPCYAQPEKVRLWANRRDDGADVRLNGYGAPDAVFRTDFRQPSFPNGPSIVGFGGAFTEAASLNYQSLSEAGKGRLMELFFGKSGLGYSIGRVHINSCDFSVQSYSFDETDGDFDLKDFDANVTHDAKTDGMIDMMLRATAVFGEAWTRRDNGEILDSGGVADGDFKVFASPWSPPSWMKNPSSYADLKAGLAHASGMTGSTQPSCLREGTGKNSRYAKAWALYFSKFITACEWRTADVVVRVRVLL